MTNTHSDFLKEMGITQWTSRDAVPPAVEMVAPPNVAATSDVAPIQRASSGGFLVTSLKAKLKLCFKILFAL